MTYKPFGTWADSRSRESLVARAMIFANHKHAGQKDDDGLEYILHPERVVKILRAVTEDPELIAAAWLHDTLEDTQTKFEELQAVFGDRIANLVLEVTHEGTKRTGYTFPRLQSRDAIMIKFADRLDNISRMSGWTAARRRQYLEKSCFWRM